MVRLRGDNVPPVSDYAHWNEDAQYMWYNENKYDMEHWDEPIEDDFEDRNYEDDYEYEGEKRFLLRMSADKFVDTLEGDWTMHHFLNWWVVEYESDEQIANKRRN